MSQLGASNHVKVSGGAMVRAVFRRIVLFITWTVVALFIVYVLFAATLWRVVPSTSGTGAVIVTTITAEGGHILPDTDILISTDAESDGSVMRNLSEAFVPSDERFIGTVVAGPYGDFEARPISEADDADNGADNGDGADTEEADDTPRPQAQLYELSFEGEDLGLNVSGFQIDERDDFERGMYLNEEYIVECVSGNCEPGDAVIVPGDYIMGEVLPTDEVVSAVTGDREFGFVKDDEGSADGGDNAAGNGDGSDNINGGNNDEAGNTDEDDTELSGEDDN